MPEQFSIDAHVMKVSRGRDQWMASVTVIAPDGWAADSWHGTQKLRKATARIAARMAAKRFSVALGIPMPTEIRETDAS